MPADAVVEGALPRAAAAHRLPRRAAIDRRVVWIWALCAGLVLYLGLDGGGYDLVVRSHAAVLVWWIVAFGAVSGVLQARRLSRPAWAAVALFAAFLIWSAIASGWSLSSESSLAEVSRLAAYLGVLVLALMSYGDRRRALGHVVGSVAAAIALLAALALLSRLRPGTFAGAGTTATLLPGAQGRLSWPLNYWNALAGMVALGLPLLVAIAASARQLAVQALAAAAIPMSALCGYLTFSRGGAIATAVGLLVFVALAADRIPKLATMLVGSAGSAALIAGAVHRHAIEQGLTGALARQEGSTLIVAVILVGAGAALAQVGIGLAARHGTPPRLLSISPARARALLVVGVVVAVAVALVVHAPARLDHAWHQFQRPEEPSLGEDTLGRYGALSGNGRYTYWSTAIRALPGHIVGGWGPGTFQLVWLPRATIPDYVVNAHSLYVETLSDVGVVGLVLLVGFLALSAGVAVRRVMCGRFERRTQAAAVAAATFAFLTSAAFDWVWQVPVLPVAWLLLVAAAFAPARALHVPGRRPPRPERERTVRSGPRAAPAARATRATRATRAAWAAWAARAPRAPRAAVALAALACLAAIGVPLATTNALRASQAAASAHHGAAALTDARTALRIEPGAASAALQAALVLEQRHRIAAAVVQARAATRDEPADWQAWLVRSRLEAEAGHAALAVGAFERARALNPESPIFHS